MQPEVSQQLPPEQGGQQVQANPAIAGAFQSVAPHPTTIAQNPGVPIQLPKEPHHFGGLITTVLLVLGLIGALGFGGWAFMSRTDYKSNSDKKSALAVTKALEEQKIKTDAEFVEKEKSPYDTYSSPAVSGSIKMQYPKTWSAYITEQSTGSSPIVGYLHPNFVPNVQDNTIAFALRLEVVNTTYSDALKQFDSYITQGSVKVAPFSFPNVPTALGTKMTGQIKPGSEKVQGTLILMPLRDKTIKLWTESNSAFGNDFNTAVIPNFTFVP